MVNETCGLVKRVERVLKVLALGRYKVNGNRQQLWAVSLEP